MSEAGHRLFLSRSSPIRRGTWSGKCFRLQGRCVFFVVRRSGPWLAVLSVLLLSFGHAPEHCKAQVEPESPIEETVDPVIDKIRKRRRADSSENKKNEWFALPLLVYSSDIGLAFALVSMGFHHEPGYEPYRDRVRFLSLLSTKLVQHHNVAWERFGIFGRPLRMEIVGSFTATSIGHYCGIGNRVGCRVEDGIEAARNAGLEEESKEFRRFVNRYFRYRLLRPSLRLRFRWKPSKTGPEFDLGWRGDYLIQGDFRSREPYAGSRYDEDFPHPESGLVSEVRIGLLLDRRDDERRPAQGFVVAAHGRLAGRFAGSEWGFAGLNIAGAGYLRLDSRGRFVWANRAVVDLIFGDAPDHDSGEYWRPLV